MKISRLSLINFRNYVNINIIFENSINILIGQNAQGKTNILEAIYFCALTHSHRTHNLTDLIMWNKSACGIELGYSKRNIEQQINIKIYNNNLKEYVKNGVKLKPKEFLGQLNAVMFSPEDLLLIKGAPVLRRKFLDNEISQTNSFYYQNLLKYNRILQQRNNLLKKIREHKAPRELLNEWDNELIKSGVEIVFIRYFAVKKMAMLANLMHRKITSNKENLKLVYHFTNLQIRQDDFNDKAKLVKLYKDNIEKLRENDILKGTTSIGPHRDDIILEVNGINLRIFGSQGQQRTGVLSLKLSELEFMKSETGEYPVLLLDDVMSELDEERREQLLLFIKDRIQTFITATDDKIFPKIKLANYYNVISGQVVE